MKIIPYESYVAVYFVIIESSTAIHDGVFSVVAEAVTKTTTSYTLPSYDINSSYSAIYNEDSSAGRT